MATAAIPVPPRLIEDMKNGDARNLRLFLLNVKERLDTLSGTTGSLSISVNNIGSSSVSQEDVQDIIGATFVDSSSIDFTYTDATDTMTATITSSYTTARDDFAVAMAIALG